MKSAKAWYAQVSLIVLMLAGLSCNQAGRKPALLDYYQLNSQVVELSSIQDGLDVPWEIQYDSGFIWYSLQKGEIWWMNTATGENKKVLSVPGVFLQRTMGALGMAVDHSADSIHVYLVYNQRTDTTKTDTSTLITTLVRYSFDTNNDSLVHPVTLLKWTANTGHNGSRVLIGNKGDLFVTTGDISEDKNAQNLYSRNGKVLRIMKDGSIPKDNPFPNSPVYSYGHRNQQGICFGENGLLYASEHGDAIEDEVNLIEPAHNYGWPMVEGKLDLEQETHKIDSLKLTITEPLISWTPTIAPAAIVYYGKGPIKDFQNSLLLVTLKGSALYVLHLDHSGKKVIGSDVFFKHRYGRLRSICIDKLGQVYIGTSNRDWNPAPGYPKPSDDHLLKIAAVDASDLDKSRIKHDSSANSTTGINKGKELYISYCSSCHKPEGEGLPGNFPPLKNNPTLAQGDKLLQILSHGRNGKQNIMGNEYDQNMPAFNFFNDDQMLDLVNYLRIQMINKQQMTLDELKSLRNKPIEPKL